MIIEGLELNQMINTYVSLLLKGVKIVPYEGLLEKIEIQILLEKPTTLYSFYEVDPIQIDLKNIQIEFTKNEFVLSLEMEDPHISFPHFLRINHPAEFQFYDFCMKLESAQLGDCEKGG